MRRRTRTSNRRLEPQHIEELLTGSDFFHDSFGADESWRRQVWEKHRNEIMAYCANPNPESWVGRLCGSNDTIGWEPGKKPWAWHQYEEAI